MQKTRCIANIVGHGRKRKNKAIRVDKIIRRKIKSDHLVLALSVKCEMKQEFGTIILNPSVRRCHPNIGIYGYVARKRSYLNKANQFKRLNYLKMY